MTTLLQKLKKAHLTIVLTILSLMVETSSLAQVNLSAVLNGTDPVEKGSTFEVIIRAEAGTLNVNGIQVLLEFDPAFVSAQSVVINSPFIFIFQDFSTSGEAEFAGGILVGGQTGTFDFATVTFQALETTVPGTTTINFNTDPGRGDRTAVAEQGTANDITGSMTPLTLAIDEPLSSVGVNKTIKLNAFPNPSKSKITFKIGENGESINTITLTDINGRVVEVIEAGNTANNYTLNLGKYSKGLYVAKITTTTGKTGQEKIIIE